MVTTLMLKLPEEQWGANALVSAVTAVHIGMTAYGITAPGRISHTMQCHHGIRNVCRLPYFSALAGDPRPRWLTIQEDTQLPSF